MSNVALEYDGAKIDSMGGDALPNVGRYGFTGVIQHPGVVDEAVEPATGTASGEVEACFELTVVVVDIDECALGSHTCGATVECVNTQGSFECESHTESSQVGETSCLHLGTQTYPQDEAPHDDEALAMLSGDILRLFEDKRGLLAVKNRAKHYEGGQIHQKPGMYTLKETIEHSPDDVGRTNTCVELTVVITDVDECTYSGADSAFRAVCGTSTQCRNSDGSYTCECPVGRVGTQLTASSSSSASASFPPPSSASASWWDMFLSSRPIRPNRCNAVRGVKTGCESHTSLGSFVGMLQVANFDDSTVRDSCRFATDSQQCCGNHGGLVASRTLQVYLDWVECTRAFECTDPCGSGHCVAEGVHGTCTFSDPRHGGTGTGGTSRQCGCAEGYFGTGVSCGPNQKREKRYTQEVFDRTGAMVWSDTSPKPCGCQKLEMNPCWGLATWGPGGPDPCTQPMDYSTVTNLTCYPASNPSVTACTTSTGMAGTGAPDGAKCCCAKGFVIKELAGGGRICEDPTPPRMTLNGAAVITINECESDRVSCATLALSSRGAARPRQIKNKK